jgi:hypothetical protein
MLEPLVKRRCSRARAAAHAALLIGLFAVAVGVAHAAFTGGATNPGNRITAAPDWSAPGIAPLAIGKATGGAAGALRPGAQYRVYARVADTGNPSSGIAAVTADASSLTAGQTNVPLTAGAFQAGGVSYNYRSGLLTAGLLPDGTRTFSVSAADNAGNSASASGSVAIDGAAPAPVDVQTANAGGGVAGRAEQNDTITFTFSEAMDSFSLAAGWDGSPASVTLRLRNSGGGAGGDRVEIWNAANTSQLAFGDARLGRADYVTGGSLNFTNSLMTVSGTSVTVVLGTASGTAGSAAGPGTITWDPSALATDVAGNGLPALPVTESGPPDSEF